MNLTGPAYLTTRTHDNIFKQLKVQWFLQDRVGAIPDNIELNLGCTIICNNAEDNIGIDSFLHVYGKDMQGNLYYKKIIIRRDETAAVYNSDAPFRVVEGIFFVRKVARGNVNYYILEDKGIYMLIDVSEFNDYVNTTYQSSVYEFNTMFPASTTTLTKIYANDTLIDVHNLKFNNSSDVLWDVDGSSIIASSPPPDINELEQRQYIESINGILMTSGVVNVSYSLGREVNVETVPEQSDDVFYPVIAIPDDASTSTVYIPLKIEGIKKNEDVYKDYGFDKTIFNHTWQLQDDPASWYKSCETGWVTPNTSKDKPKDTLGIAGLTLGVDGNVPTVPALSANIVGFTPEYRLFNPQFTSKTVKKVTQEDIKTGSFTIVKKYGKKRYTVKDASGTVDKEYNMAIIIDDNGQYTVYAPPFNSDDKGTIIACAYYNEAAPEDSVVEIEIKEEDYDYSPLRGIAADGDYAGWPFIEKIVGRVIKPGTKTKVYQEHTGVMYFDFREGGDTYNGQFKISYTTNNDAGTSPDPDAPKTLMVKGGRVRIINNGYDIEDTDITAAVAGLKEGTGVIYIHAMVNDGIVPSDGEIPAVTSFSAVIEVSATLPTENIMNSYYLLGSVNEGAIVQDHHGGTPLFLFFGNDCS